MQINVDLVYPIGSIYMTTSTVSPAVLFGGTWERIKGRCIVGVDENDTDFNTVSKTGGEKAHTLTVDEMPSHNHQLPGYGYQSQSSNLYYKFTRVAEEWGFTSTANRGGSQAHNNLQPYYTAFIWRRTA